METEKLQSYIDNTIREFTILNEERKLFQKEWVDTLNKNADDIEKSGGIGEWIKKLDKEGVNLYFKASCLSNDCMILIRKVIDLKHTLSVVDVEVNIESILEEPEVKEFYSRYIPYQTEFGIDEEEKVKIKNEIEYGAKLEHFEKTVKTNYFNEIVKTIDSES